MSSVSVYCPRCQSAQMYRHGQNPKGDDRFRFRDYHRVFQLTYAYEVRRPRVNEPTTEMAFKGAGVRDIVRTLKVGIDTVIQTLKKLSPRRVTSSSVAHADVALTPAHSARPHQKKRWRKVSGRSSLFVPK